MMHITAILLAVLAVANQGLCHYSASSDAFHDVIHFLHGQFSTEGHVTPATLEHPFEELLEKVECAEKVEDCEQCLATLLTVYIHDEVETIEQWNEVSAAVLYAVLDPAAFCNNTEVEMRQLNTTNALLGLLGTNPTNGIGEEQIELLLEMLTVGFSGEEHHEEEETTSPPGSVTTSAVLTSTAGNSTSAANSTAEEDHDDDDHDDDDHDDHDHGDEDGHDEDDHDEDGHGEEDHHETAMCFGEGTLLHYMGLDHEDKIYSGRVAEMAGVLVSFLVQDWVVDEACQVLPRQSDILESLFETLGDSADLISEEGFEELLEVLGIGSVAGAPTVPSTDDGHNHKRSISLSRSKRSADDEAIASQCMGEGMLAAIYGLELDEGISRDQFIQLCPALVQQKISNSCVPVVNTTTTEEEHLVTTAETFGYGVLAVMVITLLALTGIILIPCLSSLVIQYVLSMLVALGVGTMLGDALLHLMPQALGLHAHGEEEEVDHVGGTVTETVLAQLLVCAAIYAFWLFETLMSFLRPNSAVHHGHSHGITETVPKDVEMNGKISVPGHDTGTEQSLSGSDIGSSCIGSTEESKSKTKKGIPSIALMILVGDGLHNFIDGIAIGVAFSSSLQDGLGTSIAVFCHELPHELGDFSMLLRAGMSKIKAILFNLLSASMCLIGFFIGAAVGGASANARMWLLALTAGMFIYIALVDMMPQLMAPVKEGRWWIHFLMQNVGILLGFVLMLLIAVFEESIIHFA